MLVSLLMPITIGTAVIMLPFLRVVFRRSPANITPFSLSVLIGLWSLACSIEYGIFGPWSYLEFGAQLDVPVSIDLFLERIHDGGQFSHSFGGGVDVSSINQNTGAIIKLERLLVRFLPLWLAIFLHKFLIAAVATSGMYLLCRKLSGCHWLLALGLAALGSLGFPDITRYTYGHGLGFALIPWLAYILIASADQPASWYWPSVGLVSALSAISSTPMHSGMALGVALVILLLIARLEFYPRIFLSFIIVVATLVINWHDGLLSKVLIAPFTYRATSNLFPGGYSQIFDELFMGLMSTYILFLAFGVAGVIAAFVRSNPMRWRVAFMVTAMAFSGIVLQLMPWRYVGLRPLESFGFTYAYMASATVFTACFVVGAFNLLERPVSASMRQLPDWFHPTLHALVVSLALGSFASTKFFRAADWLGSGGLPSIGENVARLQAANWRPTEPIRVVSIPYRLASNVPAAAGLDTLDANYPVVPHNVLIYWVRGIQKIEGPFAAERPPTISFARTGWDLKCCQVHNVDTYLDTRLLRIANVGFLISAVPLRGKELQQVDGPSLAVNPLLTSGGVTGWLKRRLSYIFWPAPLYVYALASPLPRAFGAKSIIVAPEQADDKTYIDLVAQHALERAAVIRGAHLDHPLSGLVSVRNFSLVTDGVVIELDAVNGGVLLVNIAHSPFWHASADGKPLSIIPANGIQMAVSVPAGTRNVVFRYHRPTVMDIMLRSNNQAP